MTAMTGDAAMRPLAVESGCGVCLMHILGTPRTMQERPVYADVVAEVFEYLQARHVPEPWPPGVPQDRIAVDPGIGFGKTAPPQPATTGQCRGSSMPWAARW